MTKILTADDSQFMRKVLTDILEKNGYTEVVQASNGAEAVEMYKQEKPDLVLLDVIMPEGDGIDVLKTIIPDGAKVIMISAVGQDDIIQQAKDFGALSFIVKPFEEEQVMAEVKKVLEG